MILNGPNRKQVMEAVNTNSISFTTADTNTFAFLQLSNYNPVVNRVIINKLIAVNHHKIKIFMTYFILVCTT
jgi:hypothetical protein